MANAKHLRKLKQGVNTWNAWRKKYPETTIDLSEADLRQADLSEADLRQADLSEADLRQADLRQADLSGAHLIGAHLIGAHLSRANLSRASLVDAALSYATLSRADLSGAALSYASLLKADLRQADLSEANLRGADLLMANLSRADLRQANLSRADLVDAALSGADLSGADLSEAKLLRASLRRANLSRASLRRANLSDAALDDATLSGVDLSMANLIQANLDGALLTDAWLWETQRAGWSIQGIICEAVYWDEDRRERTTYTLGEFERLYADKTKIVLHYEGGINPIEIVALPALIQRIAATQPACILRLQSVQDAPSGATVTLVVDDGGGRNSDELGALKTEIETISQRAIQAQRALLGEQKLREQIEFKLQIVYDEILPRIGGHTTVYGELTMGDKFENIQNTTIVNRALVEKSFNKVKSDFDEETAVALKKVADEIEKSHNKEAAENFESFNEELQKLKPKRAVLRTLWSGVTTALPTIIQMTDVTTKIAKLLGS